MFAFIGKAMWDTKRWRRLPNRERPSINPKKPIMLVCCVVVAALLISSAISHLDHPHEFFEAVRDYRILNDQGSFLVAIVLPVIHLVLGFGILHSDFQTVAARLALILFVSYLMMQGIASYRGLEISCGCFAYGNPADRSEIGWKSLAIAGLGLLASGILVAIDMLGSDSRVGEDFAGSFE